MKSTLLGDYEMGISTELKMHTDVEKVAAYMVREIRAEERVAVAEALARVAPVIWPASPTECQIPQPILFSVSEDQQVKEQSAM